jgi:deoxyxylulose-5-phosphate synthase
MVVPVLNLGLPDRFIEHGSHKDQLSWVGLDSASIMRAISQVLADQTSGKVVALSPREPLEIGRKSP